MSEVVVKISREAPKDIYLRMPFTSWLDIKGDLPYYLDVYLSDWEEPEPEFELLEPTDADLDHAVVYDYE